MNEEEEEIEESNTTVELDDKLHRQINISKPEISIIISTECRDETLDDLLDRALYILDEYGSNKH